jgi:hypothetical protein
VSACAVLACRCRLRAGPHALVLPAEGPPGVTRSGLFGWLEGQLIDDLGDQVPGTFVADLDDMHAVLGRLRWLERRKLAG